MTLPASDASVLFEPGRLRRRRLVLALGAIVVLLIVALTAVSGVPFRNDFAAYWPVGRLLLTGQNPYDAGGIEALQRSVGDMLGGDSVVRYPPWALPLLIPFAALPYVPGWYLWIFFQTLLVGVSSAWLWRLLGGHDKPGIPLAVAFGFPAGLFVALGGQIGGVLLFGVSAFLWAILRRRDIVAGVCLGLLTLKPHLFIPLGILVLLWSAREERWRIPAAAVLTTLAGCIVALALRPEVFADYLELLVTPGTSWSRAVAVGTAASTALDGRAPWLQWAPAALIALLTVVSWSRYRNRFNWRKDLPLVLTLGLFAAPYLLVHDLVLLIPALLTMALCVLDWESTGSRRIAAAAFAVLCVVVWVGQIAERTLFIHVWVAPVMLILAIRASRCVPAAPGEAGLASEGWDAKRPATRRGAGRF
jgi:hypothetical protein